MDCLYLNRYIYLIRNLVAVLSQDVQARPKPQRVPVRQHPRDHARANYIYVTAKIKILGEMVQYKKATVCERFISVGLGTLIRYLSPVGSNSK